MRTTIHTSLSVRGALTGPKRHLRWMFRDTTGRRLTPDEAREYLLDQLAQGRELLPFGECAGFDFKTGCPGHPTEATDAR